MTKSAIVKTAIDASQIHTRAMLVSLHISTWTARRYDKKITDKVNADHAATRDAGRYNKMLLPGDCPSYKALMQAASDARTTHYTHTLPWSDEGKRLITTAEFTRYSDLMRAKSSIFSTNLATFVDDYPMLRDLARVRLNGMYRDDDYPTVADLRARFSWSLDFDPLPIAGDFRVDLPRGTVEQLETATANRVQSAIGAAMADAWARLRDVVARAAERLGDKDAIFRDSLIGNIRETVDVLATLNVTGDANLERMRVDVTRQLARYDAQALRDDDGLRARVATEADRIMATMAAFMPTATASGAATATVGGR